MQGVNIWKNLDECAFYENTIILELLDRSQEESPTNIVKAERRSNPNNTNEVTEWFCDFLDDFALIAAGPGGASNVTAACLEREELPTRTLTVRVAKNESFKPSEIQYLEGIMTIVNKVRNGDMQIQNAQDECSEAVLRHCGARVKRYITSLKEHLDSIGMEFLTRNLMPHPVYRTSNPHRESKEDEGRLGAYCVDTHLDYMRLSYERWKDMVDLVYRICSAEDQQSVHSLAGLTYQVRQSSSFRYLLESTVHNHSNVVAKVVERIGKISKFYRSAVTLVRVAAKHCQDIDRFRFRTLASQKRAINVLSVSNLNNLISRVPPASRGRLQTQAGNAQRLLRRWRHYVLHAEMQLLLFYETQPEIQLADNYIGISKRSCYLCATFIRFHGKFIMEGVHQQLYCLWTIPSTIAFRDTMRENHFLTALSNLCENVNSKVKAISARHYSQYPFHGESIANFSRDSLLSTVKTARTLISGIPLAPSTVQNTLDTLLRNGPAAVDLQRSSHQDNEERSNTTADVPPSEEQTVETRPDKIPSTETKLNDDNVFEEYAARQFEKFPGMPNRVEHSLQTSTLRTENKSFRCSESMGDLQLSIDAVQPSQVSESDLSQVIVEKSSKENDGSVHKRKLSNM
ncbi:hypothetical protein EPUS_05236 [Endocarpon pusillum Z07020]|uniref:Uncharacterized protein n=1 Tax=Endocarpon pusillum (strain Z07020 / HMAS-L-300199) TaxID=1263415 RepID=U1FZP1_ENDPU|nr:uncharacterized protein EPUS_05236 [Endocarpon pusillum Z07020]ERF70417.1 hypothetical protein EPUS_05236 [Endocarpon pusillum Z07020]